MQVITAPEPLVIPSFSLFLGGSIEQGRALRWQDKLIEQMKEMPITLLNPRRKHWNPDWKQSIQHTAFREQVEWELKAMDQADLILFYFAPNTRSPVTLLELGLFANSQKLRVCCPEGFWRKGNVDIVCQRFGIKQIDHLSLLVGEMQYLTAPPR